MTSSLLPTYARADLAFERGEGAWLISTNGDRFLDFGCGVAVTALGHAHPHLVEALVEQGQRLWHVSNLFQIRAGRNTGAPPGRSDFCRSRLLHQFRDGVARGRGEDSAEISLRQRSSREDPHHHLARRLSRPQPGGAGGWRQSEISRRFRAEAGGLRPGAFRRSRRSEGGDRPAHGRDPRRADPGRRRRACAAAKLSRGAAPALRRKRSLVDLRRGADRESGVLVRSSLINGPASRRTL